MFKCNLPPALLVEWPRSFMCHCSNMGVEWTLNKSQHTNFTLEQKILLLLLPEFKLATFWSWVWCSYQQAIPAPSNYHHPIMHHGEIQYAHRKNGWHPTLSVKQNPKKDNINNKNLETNLQTWSPSSKSDMGKSSTLGVSGPDPLTLLTAIWAWPLPRGPRIFINSTRRRSL